MWVKSCRTAKISWKLFSSVCTYCLEEGLDGTDCSGKLNQEALPDQCEIEKGHSAHRVKHISSAHQVTPEQLSLLFPFCSYLHSTERLRLA